MIRITVGELRRIIGRGLREAVGRRGRRLRYADLRSGMTIEIGVPPHDLYARSTAPKDFKRVQLTDVPSRSSVRAVDPTYLGTSAGSYRYVEHEDSVGGPSLQFFEVAVGKRAPARRGTNEGFSVRRLIEAGDEDEELSIDDAAEDADADAGSEEAPVEASSDQPALMPDGTSIDAQIDRYLIDYEKNGGRASEAWDPRSLARRLIESDGPDVPADVGTSGAPFDVEGFASSVARLVENFDSLIEVRATLVKRAEAFLRKGQADDVVQRFLDTMRERHDVDTTESVDGADEFEAPAAAGAGPGGGGP